MRHLFIAAAATALLACSQPTSTATSTTTVSATPAPTATEAPSGDYTTDKAHSSLIFRVDHLGFSKFTGRFATWDAHLHLDTAHPETSTVSVTIDPASLETDNPPPGFLAQLRGPEFLDAGHYADMGFRSTHIELTGPDTARITGDFTMHGQTHPVTLEAKFNGGYPGMALDPHARVGFSAHGTLKRSAFGISFGLPPAGTHFGVGDDVTVEIETELNGPAWTPPPAQH